VLKSRFEQSAHRATGQAEVDDFRRHRASIFQGHNDVAWFDVPMNELLLMHCGQTGRDLSREFQRQLHLKMAGAFDEAL
jgi:hypothetical protein